MPEFFSPDIFSLDTVQEIKRLTKSGKVVSSNAIAQLLKDDINYIPSFRYRQF